MYIQLTIDLNRYTGEVFDLQVSDLRSIKKVIEIVWQVKGIEAVPREGYWVRVQNKDRVCPGYETLQDSGITAGDRIEVL
ncbi:EsaB/YukD family protein [Bacillus massiliglaciei]|uniref:EsaB/YukD family protein n=1 Tax=Bacillus massiliglaciei TaxID=1816693 RepID=UPI000DA60D6E|nr:EsaB/YukD family protein [Bacillus massiliglaciei]